MSPILSELFKNVEQLSAREKWLLVNHVMNQLQQEADHETLPRQTWSDAAGMDPNLMNGVDAQQFVNNLRDEWDEREDGVRSAS